jgi:hypothetical protein
MRLTGNLSNIKTKREDSNKDIVLEIDKVEYITYKKDGRFYQPFDFLDELDQPFTITGDHLARITGKHIQEGEHEFHVFDKTEDGYTLNENKQLSLTTEYDFDADLTILTSVEYTVTVTNEDFQQIKRERSAEKKAKKGRGNKNK